MIIAAPKTGIIKANILITRNKAMDRNGTNIFLYFKPGIPKVLLVINKFVKEIVVLTPEKIIATILKSCAPKPV
jgi:hypothetical protein